MSLYRAETHDQLANGKIFALRQRHGLTPAADTVSRLRQVRRQRAVERIFRQINAEELFAAGYVDRLLERFEFFLRFLTRRADVVEQTGNDTNMIWLAAVFGDAAFYIRIERLCFFDGLRSSVNQFGMFGGKLASGFGISGLEKYRVTLNGARDIEQGIDGKIFALMVDRMGTAHIEKFAGFRVCTIKGTVVPAVPKFLC